MPLTSVLGPAIGVPAWPRTDGGWDPWLVLTIALAVLLVPRLAGLRRTPVSLIASVVTGVLLAMAVQAWGVASAAALALVGGLALTALSAVRRGRPPPV